MDEIVPVPPPGSQPIYQAADAMSLSLLFSLGRQYLNVPFEEATYIQPFTPHQQGFSEVPHFLRLEQVGVPPRGSPYDPFTALQTALSACHDPLRYTLLFVVVSDGLENRFYLGVRGHGAHAQPYAFLDYLGHFLRGNWPGTRLRRCDYNQDVLPHILHPLSRQMRHAIAMTGIPSLKTGDQMGYPQSLDRLLRGLRGQRFVYMVVAKPMMTTAVDQIIYHSRDLLSRVHTLTKKTLTQTLNRSIAEAIGQSTTQQRSLALQKGESYATTEQVALKQAKAAVAGYNKVAGVLGGVAGGMNLLSSVFPPARLMAMIAGGSAGAVNMMGEWVAEEAQLNHPDTEQRGTSSSETHTETRGSSHSKTNTLSQGMAEAFGEEYINAHAQAAERQLEQYMARFEQARAQGCWNVGTYLLAEDIDTAQQGGAQLRALLSGEKSFFEPIRTHDLARVWTSGQYSAQVALNDFEQPNLGLIDPQTGKPFDHPLGAAFNGLTTPLNTQELALLVNLPRREVPGIRLQPYADFSLNPPKVKAADLTLGHLLEGGEPTPLPYNLTLQTLTKHTLVTGITGSGKTTTCCRLLSELHQRDIPFLVIEPAKDEYVAWAMQQNQHLPPERQIAVYMPGAQKWRDVTLSDQLKLNPFDIVWLGEESTPQVLTHIDRIKSILNATFPMQEVLPILLEEALFYAYYRQGWLGDQLPPFGTFRPTLEQLVNHIRPLVKGKGYEERVAANLIAALTTRLQSLRRGWKGQLFDQPTSTPWADLFDRPVVINLSHLGDDADKAFTMAVLLQFLYEYRHAQHEMGNQQDAHDLRHLTVIEEAHRILRKSLPGSAEQANPQGKVADMFANILSEIRAYREGLMIVDQVPAKLIPDAIKNTNLKIVHRLVANDDRDAMSHTMTLTPEQASVINGLRPGQAIVYGDLDDAAAWVQVKRAELP